MSGVYVSAGIYVQGEGTRFELSPANGIAVESAEVRLLRGGTGTIDISLATSWQRRRNVFDDPALFSAANVLELELGWLGTRRFGTYLAWLPTEPAPSTSGGKAVIQLTCTIGLVGAMFSLPGEPRAVEGKTTRDIIEEIAKAYLPAGNPCVDYSRLDDAQNALLDEEIKTPQGTVTDWIYAQHILKGLNLWPHFNGARNCLEIRPYRDTTAPPAWHVSVDGPQPGLEAVLLARTDSFAVKEQRGMFMSPYVRGVVQNGMDANKESVKFVLNDLGSPQKAALEAGNPFLGPGISTKLGLDRPSGAGYDSGSLAQLNAELSGPQRLAKATALYQQGLYDTCRKFSCTVDLEPQVQAGDLCRLLGFAERYDSPRVNGRPYVFEAVTHRVGVGGEQATELEFGTNAIPDSATASDTVFPAPVEPGVQVSTTSTT